MSAKPIAWLIVSFMFVAGLEAGAAQADEQMVVIRSSHGKPAPGELLVKGQPLTLPDGAEITIVAADGSVRTLRGPFAGPLPGPARAQDRGLIATLQSLAKEQARGQVLGAVRGGAYSHGAIYAVEGYNAGLHCVPAAGQVEIRRQGAAASDSGSVQDSNTGAQAQMAWQPGQTLTLWPASVPLRDGAEYLIRAGKRAVPQRITLKLIPGDLGSDAERVRWLSEAGCKSQAMRLLQALR
ncbi:MAG: hypothetical protein KIT20_08765 [Alphaproteobacteria bacterium]|nr:hypothetical protein [Alphaproteobacteria bacterium]